MQRKMKIFDRPIKTAAQDRRSQLVWGIIGVAIAAVLLAVVGYLYIAQPGTKEYSADFKEAQAVHNGIDVRVAGVSMGKISGTELLDDRVRVKFRVKSKLFVGDSSTIEMRQLTTVGGYYMALNPLGTTELGDKPIPPERVTMPYSLLETFQQATPKVQKLDAVPIRQSLSQLNDALEGQPESIRNTVATFDRAMDNILRQQDQAGDFVKVLSEYSTTVNNNGLVLLSLMRNFSTFFSAAEVNLSGFQSYLSNLTQVVQRLTPVLNVYLNNIDPLTSRFDALIGKAREIVGQSGPLIAQGKQLLAGLQKTIAPDGTIQLNRSEETFMATNVCIPTQTVSC